MNEKVFKVFDIDLNRLEEECADQPLLYIEYSKKLQRARKELAQEKSEMELEMAEIDLEIRKNPTAFKLPEKITEAMIKSSILRQPRYKKANERYAKAQDKVNTYQIYTGALEQRCKMIGHCIQLHGQQYFAKPYTTSESRKVVAQIEKAKARRKKKKNA